MDFPLVCIDVGMYAEQGSSLQVDADAQTNLITDRPTDGADGDRRFRTTYKIF